MQLGKRVSALEQANPNTYQLTIMRRIVRPGQLDAEIDHIHDREGNEWTRQPGENEEAFTDRAEGETTANGCGIKRLIASSAEEHHAES